jgi:transcriptional regulator, pvuIIC family protein
MINMEDNMMDIVSVFADNLRKYRKEKGLSQEKFAEMTGLHRTYISTIERKKRSIALENVQKIADALEIDTYLLFISNDENLESGGRKEAKDESRKRL